MRYAVLLNLLLMTAAASVWGSPCITATTACTEWINFPGREARSMVYRTYPLNVRNESITRALIMVHGAGRDADNYFRSTVAAAFLANALEDTLVIAPRFASNNGASSGDGGCADSLAPGEVNWRCDGISWRYGGTALSDENLTSFDLADLILRQVSRREVFPNLKSIVFAGHSAGGMFTVRYAMANQVHDKLGVPVYYVVSNPSSYPYLDPLRPVSNAWPVAASAPGYIPAAPGGESFRKFGDSVNCTTYNQWPYGLQDRAGYTTRLSDEELKQQLTSRPVTFLLGELDILPLSGFDSSCAAMAQGPTRLARGHAFHKYLSERFGAHDKLIVVPLCGHNSRCMFTAESALPVLFPKP